MLITEAVTQRDGVVKIPLVELEQTNHLGESLIYEDKRPPKCAMPSCKTPNYFHYYCVSTRH